MQNSFKTTETQIATETWANYRHFISPIPSGNILDDSHLQSRLDIGLSEVRLPAQWLWRWRSLPLGESGGL